MPLGLSGVEFITQYMPGRWNHVPANEDPLERLARLAATDKQWGLHKYTDVYASLFHNMRNDRVNLTEVGVLHGASVVMWASYFRNANIYGLDPFAVPANRAEKAALERSLCAKCANITRHQHRGCPSCASRVRLHRCYKASPGCSVTVMPRASANRGYREACFVSFGLLRSTCAERSIGWCHGYG